MNVQQHVNAILAIVRVSLQQKEDHRDTAPELPISPPDRLALMESLERIEGA